MSFATGESAANALTCAAVFTTSGSRTQKVLPTPGSLSTPMSPPTRYNLLELHN
jgi:hypothetical protein